MASTDTVVLLDNKPIVVEISGGDGAKSAQVAGIAAGAAGVDRDAAEAAAEVALLAAADASDSAVAAASAIEGIDVSGAIIPVTNRTLLAAAVTSIPAFLTEAGRQGVFVWDSSNLSTLVTADTAQGIYIPPTGGNGSTGAWVRRFDGPLVATWFGVSPTATRSANSDAIEAAMAVVLATGIAGAGTLKGAPSLYVPSATAAYQFARSIELQTGMRFFGDSVEGDNGATTLDWPVGTTGIIVQQADTSGETGASVVTAHPTAAGSIVEGFTLHGNYAGTESEAHGVRLRTRATVRNCYIKQFGGNGVHIEATSGSGTIHGNANGWTVSNIVGQEVRNLLFIDGADVNAGASYQIIGVSCRQSTIYDSSFLGNAHYSPHAATCGIVVGNKNFCSHNSNHYYVLLGQETWCSTNSPTGAATNNQGWHYWGPGTPTTIAPAWSSGMTWRAGGPFIIDGAGGNQRSTLSEAYTESDQPKSQISTPSRVVGGLHGADIYGVGVLSGERGMPSSNVGFATRKTVAGALFDVNMGESGTLTLRSALHSTAMTSTYYEQLNTFSTGDIWGQFANANGVWRITGNLTAAQFGTGAAVPYVFHAWKLAFGTSLTDARIVDYGSAAHAAGAHAAGEFKFNIAPTAAGILGWSTVSAGTPGTSVANYLYPRADATTGIGYVTGAGGAVTQATSRTTGVTLNKVCGSITLVSAAGTATWQSFTVTNSAVAATDVVRVVQKSGTDKNMIHVTAVAAGSFEITFATTGGTTTEQPVFNFAVLKAVAA